jgi:ribosomal protein L33
MKNYVIKKNHKTIEEKQSELTQISSTNPPHVIWDRDKKNYTSKRKTKQKRPKLNIKKKTE